MKRDPIHNMLEPGLGQGSIATRRAWRFTENDVYLMVGIALVSVGLLFKIGAAPYLGPILLDSQGAIQWVHEQHLLSEQMRELVFSEPPLLTR